MTKEGLFWKWFVEHEEELFHANQDSIDIFNALRNQLSEISEQITFELSASPDDNRREFCISADGMKEHFPVIIDLVKVAPKLDYWVIRAFRQRIANDNIAIAIGDLEISYEDLFFRCYNDDPYLGLELHVRNFEESDQFVNATFILMDALLGEYDVATQLSSIDWIELDEEILNELSPFIELRNLIDRHKAMKN